LRGAPSAIKPRRFGGRREAEKTPRRLGRRVRAKLMRLPRTGDPRKGRAVY
jgi:hypothetical protein